MLEDEADTGIPHFVTDNISWLYPVDPKKINCEMLLRENKSLASAILDLGEQIQQMKQMQQDFCQNNAPMNNPQSEVEARIDEFLTDARNVSNRGRAEALQSAASLPSQRSLSMSAEGPIYPYTPPPHTPSPPEYPTAPHYCRASALHWGHSTHPLSTTAPPFIHYVCQCVRGQSR